MHRAVPSFFVFCVLMCALSLVYPVAAIAEPETKKTVLYGMFRQSPEGGVEFVSPQEPDVVYVPLDAASIMADVLNIQVQVRGEIRESFARQGKTTRILAVEDIRPMTAEYGATRIEKDKAVGLPGADPAEVHAYHDKTCAAYDRYAVVETLADYSDGHTLRLLARTAADAPAAVCGNLQGTPLFEIPNGGDFAFAGISGDTLFVQNGPTDAVHGLMAVNFATKRQILDGTVVPGAAIDKGRLLYRQVLPADGRKSACLNGKTAVRPMALDLKSGRSTTAGKDACWP